MDELLKQIRDGYIEDIRKALPLSRAVLVIYFWMLIAVFKTENFKGTLPALMDFSISDFFEFENGMLWKISPFDLILVVMAVLLTIWIYRILSIGVFDFFTRIRNPRPAFKEMIELAQQVVSDSVEENIQSVKKADQLFINRSRALSSRIKLGELIFGICVGIILFAQFSTLIDILFLMISVSITLVLQVNIYRYYFSKAAPIIIQRLILSGQLPEFGQGILNDVLPDEAVK